MDVGPITGSPAVFDAFFDKSKKLGIVGCAGGIRNSFMARALIYLRRQKLFNAATAHIGVSSGVATQAYFLGGGKATTVRVFSHDMTDTRMFSLRRRLVGQHPFDVDYVDRVFRGVETGRGINAYKVIEHRAPLYAVLADAVTGEAWSEKLTTPESVWQLASIATAVTGFARPTRHQDRLVTDGYASKLQLPVRELLRHEPQLTDMLVFASQHYDPRPKLASKTEMLLYRSGFAKATASVRELIRTRHVRFMAEAHSVIEPITMCGVRVCILWLPKAYHPIFVSKEESQQLIREGYYSMKFYMENCSQA